MPSMRPEGLLATPSLKATQSDFDPRPRSVDKWIATLPLGDTGECARMLYMAVCECNQTEIGKSARQHLMDMFSQPLSNVLNTLKKHYLHESLPLSEKNHAMATLAVELNAEMAMGYKIIIDQTWGTPLSMFNKAKTTLSVHRAIYYLNNVLLAAYQVYSDSPASIWLQIHQLYLYAEENQLEKTLIPNIESKNKLSKSTIRDLYKRILLVGLLTPYRFRQVIVENVYDHSEYWAKQCRIFNPENKPEMQNQVQIRLNSDAAPSFFGSDEPTNPTHSRWLDTTQLVNLLAQHLTENRPVKELSPDTVYLILLSWSGKSRRSFSRNSANNTLTVTVGLNTTYRLIKQILHLNPELEQKGLCADLIRSLYDPDANVEDPALKRDPELEASAEFANPLIYGAGSVNEVADIWDQDYASKTIGYDYNLKLITENKDKEKQHSTTGLETVDCNNINESAAGYCLIGYKDDAFRSQKVQIGELVGIRDAIRLEHEETDSMLNLGVVRRMRNTSKGLELGIQKIAPCAQVVAICRFMNSELDPVYTPALVLPELKNIEQPITLLTRNTFKTGDHVTMNKYGYKTHVKLTKLLQITGSFSQFKYDVVETLGYDKPKPLSAESDSDFDKVWQLI